MAADQATAPPTTALPADRYAAELYPIRLVNRARFDEAFRPARVPSPPGVAPGTILIDTMARLLYYVETEHEALRYGIAVGEPGEEWRGTAVVGRKEKWPAWHPTAEMRIRAPAIPRTIPPGPDNPLGARALYLYQDGRDTLIRIHGTPAPWTIGTAVSSGCFRLVNEDAIELYDKVEIGTRVIVR